MGGKLQQGGRGRGERVGQMERIDLIRGRWYVTNLIDPARAAFLSLNREPSNSHISACPFAMSNVLVSKSPPNDRKVDYKTAAGWKVERNNSQFVINCTLQPEFNWQ